MNRRARTRMTQRDNNRAALKADAIITACADSLGRVGLRVSVRAGCYRLQLRGITADRHEWHRRIARSGTIDLGTWPLELTPFGARSHLHLRCGRGASLAVLSLGAPDTVESSHADGSAAVRRDSSSPAGRSSAARRHPEAAPPEFELPPLRSSVWPLLERRRGQATRKSCGPAV